MKIILLVNHIYAMPTVTFLASKQLLQAIVMPDIVQQYNQQVELYANANFILCRRFAKTELNTSFKEWLTEQAPDMVIGYTFPYKIPEEIFNIPKYGFFNVHYSMLPAYMGPFPVFWQIKNGDNAGGITIHKMDKGFDTGEIILQQEVLITPGETQGLYSARLSMLAVDMIFDFINKVSGVHLIQVESISNKSYYSKPELTDFTIDWKNQSASEIENMVNACNSEIGGAITTFRGQVIKIIEVSKAVVNGDSNSLPGTIVYSDENNGIYVACKDNTYLKINIIQMPEGIFSGNKFAAMGIQAGNNFN